MRGVGQFASAARRRVPWPSRVVLRPARRLLDGSPETLKMTARKIDITMPPLAPYS